MPSIRVIAALSEAAMPLGIVLLKEGGSLNIEWINKLPYEEYMNAMGNLTQEQVEEYLST